MKKRYLGWPQRVYYIGKIQKTSPNVYMDKKIAQFPELLPINSHQ
jgi:hypothetical protein